MATNEADAPKPYPEIEEDSLLPRDTTRSLPLAMLRAREAVMMRFRPLLASSEITEQQWRVIRVLAERSPLDASQVAERACVLAPSLTRILKALEDRGFVRRERDEADARRLLLSLEPAGLELIRGLTPRSVAIYAQLEERYGRGNIDRLIDMLNELAATRPDT